MYKPITCSDRVIDVREKHVCSSDTSINLYCLDEYGRMHRLMIVFEINKFLCIKAVSTMSLSNIVSVNHWLLLWFVLDCGHLLRNILIWHSHLNCWIGQKLYC